MVIRVEEGPIANESWHFEPLVHNLEPAFFVNWDNCHFFVIGRQNLLVVLEELDELIGHHSIYSHLANCQWLVIIPLLKDNQLLFLIFVHDRDLALSIEKMRGFIQELLLNVHSTLHSIQFHS